MKDSMDIKEQIQNNLFDKNKQYLLSGKIKVIEPVLKNAILDRTKFMDYLNPKFKYRIYAILQNHIDIPVCKVCGQKVNRFATDFQNNVFHYNCSHCFATKNRGRGNYGKEQKERNTKNYQNLIEIYTQKRYELIDKNILINVIKEKEIKYRNNISLFRMNCPDHLNSICSVLYHTISLIDIDFNDLKLSERCYVLSHNISNIPVCPVCGVKLNYRNRVFGYPVSCQKHSSVTQGGKKRILSHLQYIEEKLSEFDYAVLNEIETYKGLNKSKLEILHTKCNNVFYKWLADGKVSNIEKLCPYCYPQDIFHSHYEYDIQSYIKSFYTGQVQIGYKHYFNNINNHRELDIYIPNVLGIEFNGNYWHSDKNKSRTYHVDKTNLFESNNIQVLHVYEHEWNSIVKQLIWKSIFRMKLNLSETKLYARKCHIKEITDLEKSQFLFENHLQGNDRSKIRLGLFYNNKLVSVMTFGKSRYNNNYEYELLRFATKLNTNVIGGAGKLLKYFETCYNPKSLISYANRRYSQGNLYKKLGFVFSHNSPPNYIWVNEKENIIYTRMETQKHRLEKIFDNYDKNLSENENMINNNFLRIWDCGNMVFIKNYNRNNNISVNCDILDI